MPKSPRSRSRSPPHQGPARRASRNAVAESNRSSGYWPPPAGARFDGFEVLEDLRSRLGATIAGADVSVEKPADGPSTGPPINVEIAGEDPDVWGRWAIAVIAGLTFATFLTLILVSVMYSMFSDLEAFLVRTFTRRAVETEAEEAETQERPDSLPDRGVSGEPVPV